MEALPKKYSSRYYRLKVGHGAVRAFFARIDVLVTLNFSDAEKQSTQLNTCKPNVVDGERREGNWSENCTQTVSVLSIEASDHTYFLTGSGKCVSTSY